MQVSREQEGDNTIVCSGMRNVVEHVCNKTKPAAYGTLHELKMAASPDRCSICEGHNHGH